MEIQKKVTRKSKSTGNTGRNRTGKENLLVGQMNYRGKFGSWAIKEREDINMKNLGFISKKKVAKEIAEIYKSKGHDMFDSGSCSALNLLCKRLKIKPIHLNDSANGTGELSKK